MKRHRVLDRYQTSFQKAVAFALLLSFVLPASQTFAQEGSTEELVGTPSEPATPPSEDIERDPDPLITEPPQEESESNPETPPKDTESPEENPDSQKESDLEPEALMASGSSDTEAGAVFINNETTRSVVPEVDTQTGALTYSYPIIVPPGRNGMTPSLTLEYNSGKYDNTSIFGYGWSVSIPSIERVNKLGSDNLYASSTSFRSSLDGELIQVSTTTYKARIDNGTFREYTLVGDAWTILEKDGRKLFFGTTTNSRHSDPANNSHIYKWYLEEERDTNDNYVEYSYYKDSGQIYPDTVTYTGHGVTDGPFSVTFSRETRNDNLVSGAGGFIATTSYRISRIETNINGSWVGRYDLGYVNGHNGNRSLLGTITRSGRDEEGTITTIPSLNLSYETYGSGDKEWAEDSSWYVPVNIAREERGYDDGARFVDINGDSRTDIIQSAYTSFYPTPSSVGQTVYLNTGDEWATSTNWTIPAPIVKSWGGSDDLPTVIYGENIATTSTYAYDAVGNIASTSHLGSFAYAETSYANPHAVTGIGGITYTYDENGNLTGYTGGNTLAWDYRNRLTSTSVGGTGATYAYDQAGQRVRKTVGGLTTKYPNNLYEHSSATTTKHIYAGEALVGSVYESGSTTAEITYTHADHLGSTIFVSDEGGVVSQSLSYSPWGAQESNTIVAERNQSNQYIGENFDPESQLSYLNARMYNGANGKFLSQDPVFWEVGQTPDGKAVLQLPQLQNSYSYAGNNPVTHKDPTGRLIKVHSRPVDGLPGRVGAHTTVEVTPDNPDTIHSIPDIDTTKPFTLSGIPENGTLYKRVNNQQDVKASRCGSGCPDVSSVTIAPPDGMSSEDFDNAVIDSFNNLSNEQGYYNFFGSSIVEGFYNSNNITTSILHGAGVSQGALREARGQLQTGNMRWAPGFGSSVHSTDPHDQVSKMLGMPPGLF